MNKLIKKNVFIIGTLIIVSVLVLLIFFNKFSKENTTINLEKNNYRIDKLENNTTQDLLPEKTVKEIDNLPTAELGNYSGEKTVLPDGQTLCDFQRSVKDNFPEDYNTSLQEGLCDPSK